MCVPTGTRDWERPERAPYSAGWAPRRQKSSRCSPRSRSRGGLERRPIDPRLWARNLDVGNEAPATGFGRGARGGGAGVGVGCAGPRRTTGRANGAREQKNILAAAPAFGGSLDRTMGRVCAGWQGRGRAGSARGFALVCAPVRLFSRSPQLLTLLWPIVPSKSLAPSVPDHQSSRPIRMHGHLRAPRSEATKRQRRRQRHALDERRHRRHVSRAQARHRGRQRTARTLHDRRRLPASPQLEQRRISARALGGRDHRGWPALPSPSGFTANASKSAMQEAQARREGDTPSANILADVGTSSPQPPPHRPALRRNLTLSSAMVA